MQCPTFLILYHIDEILSNAGIFPLSWKMNVYGNSVWKMNIYALIKDHCPTSNHRGSDVTTKTRRKKNKHKKKLRRNRENPRSGCRNVLRLRQYTNFQSELICPSWAYTLPQSIFNSTWSRFVIKI